MGKKITIEYEDDLTGDGVDAAIVDTVDFSYRGSEYSLVLTPENGALFDADMARWIVAAKKAQVREARQTRQKAAPTVRKAAATQKTTQTTRARATKAATATPATPRRGRKSVASVTSADRSRVIREWAIANGHTVSPRGRLSREVIDAYNAVH